MTDTLFNVAADGRTFWQEPELPFEHSAFGLAAPAPVIVEHPTPAAVAARRDAVELVVVVPCSAAKLDLDEFERRPAGEVYTGAFHRYARQHAERLGADRVVILSALHGLIELDKLVAAYDITIGDEHAYGARPGIVRNQARQLGLTADGVVLVSFCPNRYTAVLVDAGLGPVTPLAGARGIGEQRGRLNRLTLADLLP